MADTRRFYILTIRQKVRKAIKKGKRTYARSLLHREISLHPDFEELWLLMGELSSGKASIEYYNKALEINPDSKTAREAIHRFIQEKRHSDKIATQQNQTNKNSRYQEKNRSLQDRNTPEQETQIVSVKRIRFIPILIQTGSILLAVFLFGIGYIFWAEFSNNTTVLANSLSNHRPVGFIIKPTLTASATSTSIEKATHTTTPLPSIQASQTPTQDNSPVLTETEIFSLENNLALTPTASAEFLENQSNPPQIATGEIKNVLLLTQEAENLSVAAIVLPTGVAPDERWIDINLSNQQLNAYMGVDNIRSFTVSSGTSYTPTPTGIFHIYVKYPAADMYGPGYYLPGVPSVMYFNKDYGIHGAYWHMNFGTPMSHGCVNMKLEDAAWLFDWASVGTAVNIHY